MKTFKPSSVKWIEPGPPQTPTDPKNRAYISTGGSNLAGLGLSTGLGGTANVELGTAVFQDKGKRVNIKEVQSR